MDEASVTNRVDNAGVLVPPPLFYVAHFFAGLGLQRAIPLPQLPYGASLAGWAVLSLGLLINFWSIGLFRRKKTSLVPIKPSNTLVIEGPYHFTRNPMYLGLLISYLGAALLTHELWPLLLSPAVVLVINQLVIRKEEQYLTRKFGHDYATYKKAVHRWI